LVISKVIFFSSSARAGFLTVESEAVAAKPAWANWRRVNIPDAPFFFKPLTLAGSAIAHAMSAPSIHIRRAGQKRFAGQGFGRYHVVVNCMN
jgi:hypothetical protein